MGLPDRLQIRGLPCGAIQGNGSGAGAAVGRANLVGRLGDRPAALALYRKALLLAEKYWRSAHAKDLILRGIGFSLTEIGDLDGAGQAYRDSLMFGPVSKPAKDELDYLEGLREEVKRKP